jgi:hypothetical protein
MVLFPAIANFAVWFLVIHLFRRARTQRRT